jgi:hypothetical protein
VSELLTVDGGGTPDSGSGTTLTNLELQVFENACANNLAQDYFEVTNGSNVSVPLSNVTMKSWIYGTRVGSHRPATASGCSGPFLDEIRMTHVSLST